MKICFLCGSVEPGKNGVGDYARRLAGELIRDGADAFLVGIHESGIERRQDEVQTDAQTKVQAYRWPTSTSWKVRFQQLRETLQQNSTTHISVQFVAYAFDHHGLPYQFTQQLIHLKTSAEIHFTIHEIWCRSDSMSWKQRVLAYLQGCITRKLLNAFPSSLKHTSLPLYQQELARLQVESRTLPIFSNIAPLPQSLTAAPQPAAENSLIQIAFFSQFSMHPAICDFLKAFQKDCMTQQKSLSILLMGGHPARAKDAIQTLRMHLGDRIPITHTGFLSTEEASQRLHEIDFGISPVPRHLIGKSGSTAAFLSHGKPIAIPHTEEGESPSHIGFTIDCLRPALFTTPTLASMQKSSVTAQTNKHAISLASVAAQLSHDLNTRHTAASQSTSSELCGKNTNK